MKVIDLFCGLRGWSEPFESRGHDVFSTDIDGDFNPTLAADILELKAYDFPQRPDIILASPPCEGFSVMGIGRNWNRDHTPKTEKAVLSMKLVEKTIELIIDLKPKYFLIENPRGKLRRMPFMQQFERRTVTYCRYGLPFMKPTDLWGGFPSSLELRPMCQNGNDDHIAAPRGSKVGVQGWGALTSRDDIEWKNRTLRRGSLTLTKDALRAHYGTSDMKKLAALRAKIPPELSLEVCIAAENDLNYSKIQ